MKKPKIILFTSHGLSGRIVYSYLEKEFDVLGVVFDTPNSKLKMIKRRIKKLGYIRVILQLLFMKLLVPLIEKEAKNRKKELLLDFNLNSLDKCKNIFHPKSINDPRVIEYVNTLNPDVVMVCGTNLIWKKTIDGIMPPLINMHVGITPKYRGVHGGYWALVNRDKENCGVTVHLIDPGIDTGGIISQKIIYPTKKDNYATYPIMQIISGLECIKDAIDQIFNNRLTIIKNGLPSKLYYHPTITSYLYNRFANGVK